MPDAPEQVSHLEIYRLLIEVKTTLDMALKQRAEDKKRDDEEKLDIFKRLKELEGSTAKWAGIVLAVSFSISVVMPVLVVMLAPRLEFGPEQQAGHVRPGAHP